MKNPENSSRPFLEIPERFNMGAWVVDRHVAEGRGGKLAAWAGGRSYTFDEIRQLSIASAMRCARSASGAAIA